MPHPVENEVVLELELLLGPSCETGAMNLIGFKSFGGQVSSCGRGLSADVILAELAPDVICMLNDASARGPQSAKAKPSQKATANSARML